jgi:hypothetical protein
MNIYTNKEFAALALSNPKELLLAFQDIYINHYNGFNTKEDESQIDCDLLFNAAEIYLDGTGVLGLYLKVVYQKCGHDGNGGNHTEMIFAVSDNNNVLTYLQITGYYDSYIGTEWGDEVVVVYPREIIKIQYFPLC